MSAGLPQIHPVCRNYVCRAAKTVRAGAWATLLHVWTSDNRGAGWTLEQEREIVAEEPRIGADAGARLPPKGSLAGSRQSS
jgi:hypothetical protein